LKQNIPARLIGSFNAPQSLRQNFFEMYGVAKRKIVPGLRYSQEIYEDVLKDNITGNLNWLDIGCGHHLLPQWRLQQEKELIEKAGRGNVIGLDYDFPSLLKHKTISKRIQGTADELPFEDGCFDIATANMVVEHLDNPRVQFAEINRVLKPGGIFIFHTVNKTGYFALLRRCVPKGLVNKLARHLDGREADDVFAVHYKANSEKTINLLASETGFEVEKIRLISSDAIFARIAPLAVAELLWLRLLMAPQLQRLRTNIIATLRKKTDGNNGGNQA
jgi:ubiquinone/menaquinone biosynthesis C-methylase UbiE